MHPFGPLASASCRSLLSPRTLCLTLAALHAHCAEDETQLERELLQSARPLLLRLESINNASYAFDQPQATLATTVTSMRLINLRRLASHTDSTKKLKCMKTHAFAKLGLEEVQFRSIDCLHLDDHPCAGRTSACVTRCGSVCFGFMKIIRSNIISRDERSGCPLKE